MNKIQIVRWEAAKKLFEKMIYTAKLSSSEIWWDGTEIKPEDIVINDTGIYVLADNIVYTQFRNNSDYDEGLFTRKIDFAKIVRSQFKLVKYIRY